VDVYLDLLAALEHLRRTLDVMAHQIAADVIGVKVGDQRAFQRHVVLRQRVEDGVDIPRRVDRYRVTRRAVADQVDEVLHRSIGAA
jgi:hypothetical protein